MGEDGRNFCDLTTGLLCVMVNAAGSAATVIILLSQGSTEAEERGHDCRAVGVQRRISEGRLLLVLWVFVVIETWV